MTEPGWQACPKCGVSLKSENLAEHRERVHGRRRPSPAKRRRAILVALVVVVVVASAWLILRAGEDTALAIGSEGEPTWGSPDAPVEVYLFADYQCPACRRFEVEGGLDRLLRDWVEPGTVRVVYKDLAFIGEDSIVAAEASQVVWAMDPAAWPSWNRFIFERQGLERSGWADRDGVVALTQQWGQVDMEEFTARLDSREFLEEVRGDIAEAREAGVSATPTLVVGTKRINALDAAAVDDALREATGQ
jgi:protein-disulfide isomerase